MVKHAPAIYSYSLACCSGGGEQKSVDNCIDSAWKEIKSLSVTTNMNFPAIETFHSSVHSLQWFSQSFLYKTQALITIVSLYLSISTCLFRFHYIFNPHPSSLSAQTPFV